MNVLAGLRALQIGPGLAAAVCGRAFADAGATVDCLAADCGSPMAQFLNFGKRCVSSECTVEALATHAAAADLMIVEGTPQDLASRGIDEAGLREANQTAVLVLISPFGQTGPDANRRASDLTLICASGIARRLTGQVDDLSEPPTRAVGEQSAFIGGLAAAAAGMQALLSAQLDVTVDVSIQEALATLAVGDLAGAGQHGKTWSRLRTSDGNGATVTILPASDGYVAISPREDHQWTAWLDVMGAPDWGKEPRFARKPDRIENWDALHALMSDWSRKHPKQWIADAAQQARVPSFPLQEATEHFASKQLAHRGFFRLMDIDGASVLTPGPPFGTTAWESKAPDDGEPSTGGGAPLPLSGLRVVDFSWVIAGPTTTRYLAAMGAEVIKIEAPGRGDPGRGMGLHQVLGQGKRGITLDLKNPGAIMAAKALSAKADIVIENFGTGVMERLGLGPHDVAKDNPNVVYISASGHGRTGPEAEAVAYGTLLQCYAGFARLNGHPDTPPRVGMAWLDPMCALMLAFIAAAGIWQRRRSGAGMRVDFSMMEAMLWTMAATLLTAQRDGPPQPQGNADENCVPHGIYPANGDDAWVAIAVPDDDAWQTLCALIEPLSGLNALDVDGRRARVADIEQSLAAWTRAQTAEATAAELCDVNIPAAPVASSLDLLHSTHLQAREFWHKTEAGPLPGLPWKTSFGYRQGPAPKHGADTAAVLGDVLGLSADDIAALQAAGTFG